METIVQRICWNSRGWQIPSGSAYEKGFPSQKGFGHEEWNFQLEDSFEDYVYGYTYTKPAEAKVNKSGGKFRIVFFSIHPETKERFVVGIYHAAEFIPEDAYDLLFKYFGEQGIFERRAEELHDASEAFTLKEALREVKNSVKKRWLSVRCPISQIETFDQYPLLDTITGSQSVGHRFTRFTYLTRDFPQNNAPHGESTRQADHATTQGPLAEDSYYRESAAKLRIIVRRHSKLSNDFCRWLKKEHGIEARQEQQRVDVRFSYDNKSALAELKVCYGVGTTKAMREALGQLLEYNHYPKRVAADLWLIVLDDQPSKKDQRFIDLLRKERSLPVTVGWRNKKDFLFHPDWPQK